MSGGIRMAWDAVKRRSALLPATCLIVAACHPALLPKSPGVTRLGGPGVKVVPLQRDYEVTGSTAIELLESMRQWSPGGFGLHNVEFRRAYSLAEGAALCRAQQVTVEVVSEIRLPEWVARPATVDSQLVTQWTLFVANLRSHEEVHRTMAIRIANDLVRELRAVETRTCVGWIDAAEQLTVRARREYAVKQERYDRDARARLRWPPRTIFDPGPPPAPARLLSARGP